MIHAAAIKHNGIVYTLPRPNRHIDVFLKAMAPYTPKLNYSVVLLGAGFITDTGQFIDRAEAYRMAVAADLIPGDGAMGGQLYTEMVW